jgi:hypothetical protein
MLDLTTNGSQTVTLDALRTIPIPPALGSRHAPIPHAALVEALVEGITGRGWRVHDMDLVVAAHGAMIFGTMDLRDPPLGKPGVEGKDTGTLFGFRSSTDQSLAIQGVAGKRVFVCSNMCFSGDLFVMRRKSTTRIDLPEVINAGLDQFLTQSRTLDANLDRLRNTALTDTDAKARIFDVFNAEVLPSRLLKPMAEYYFRPTEEQTDLQPRSLWGLNNAATRSVQLLKSPAQQFDAAQNVGQHFQLAA